MAEPARANPVRDIHNAVARSTNDAEASTRPPETSAGELRRMTADVLEKLRLDPSVSVLEIGCGTGLLAVPIARSCARFVGIDFADQALGVLGGRLRDEGLEHKAALLCVDFLAVPEDDLAALGTFDRVLAYSVLHYAPDEAQAREFLGRALRRLAPGGFALFGNLPLWDLERDTQSVKEGPAATRVLRMIGWILRGPALAGRSAAWRAASIPYRMAAGARRAIRPRAFEPQRLPPKSCVELTMAAMNRWLDELPEAGGHQWLAPRVGTPMFMSRADLLVWRR